MLIGLALSPCNPILNKGGGVSYPQLEPGSIFVIQRDSIEGQGANGNADVVSVPGNAKVFRYNNGYMEAMFGRHPVFNFEMWAADTSSFQSGYSVRYVDGGNRAMPGAPLDYQEAIIASSIAMGPLAMALGLTVNSRAIADAADRLIAMAETARAAGIYVIVETMPPINAGASFDDANYQLNHLPQNQALRDWANSQPKSQVGLLDWSILMDPSLTGYCTVAGMFRDGVHPVPYGASLMAEHAWDTIYSKIVAPGPSLFDQYFAELTNYMPNWNFATPGAPFSRGGVWASGSAGPALFRGQGLGSSVSTCISTLEANPLTGGNSIVMPITPAATAIAEEGFVLLGNNTGANNGFISLPELAGKWVVAAFEVELPSNSYHGTPSLLINDNANNTGRLCQMLFPDSATTENNNSIRKAKAESFYLLTDPVKLDAASTGPRVQLTVRHQGAAAYAAGITTPAAMGMAKIKKSGLFDVGDPKGRRNVV